VEKRDLDFYTFFSPKLERRVEIIGLPAMCLSLLNEFNCNIDNYVERPRILHARDRRHELTSWIRDRAGRERFLIAMPHDDCTRGAVGRQTHRQAAALLDASSLAQMQLIFVSDSEIIDQRNRISQALRMLPYVQVAHGLPNRPFLRQRVLELFRCHDRAQFSQIEKALVAFNAADVRAVVCDLVHDGWLEIDARSDLDINTLVRRAAAHAT
jgi:hypothetical protein